MKVLVCGGRKFGTKWDHEKWKEVPDIDAINKLYEVLDGIEGIDTIISGHATGADQLGEMYADERHLKVELFPAEWDKHGKKAGFIRNKKMLDEGKPDLVVGFPGGKGTIMMCNIAERAGVEVKRII